MAREYEIRPSKTYSSKENVRKAVAKTFGDCPVRYSILKTEDGRYFPLFIGQECIQYGVHFKFNVVG